VITASAAEPAVPARRLTDGRLRSAGTRLPQSEPGSRQAGVRAPATSTGRAMASSSPSRVNPEPRREILCPPTIWNATNVCPNSFDGHAAGTHPVPSPAAATAARHDRGMLRTPAGDRADYGDMRSAGHTGTGDATFRQRPPARDQAHRGRRLVADRGKAKAANGRHDRGVPRTRRGSRAASAHHNQVSLPSHTGTDDTTLCPDRRRPHRPPGQGPRAPAPEASRGRRHGQGGERPPRSPRYRPL
jgi:hypothetical protein